MTLIEAVFATILFDLALFGTSNPIINAIIRLFTNLQNSWDRPFQSKDVAKGQIIEFCNKLSIQYEPWIWEKDITEYASLNDFFARTYDKKHFPPIGNGTVVSPACCTLTRYNDNEGVSSLLIKGCDYQIDKIGLPSADIEKYRQNHVLIGYLSPADYHRVHAPVTGTCVHCSLEGAEKRSASVKFFGGTFNIMNENKRLVIVLETTNSTSSSLMRVALVVIGGIGVDTIVYNPNLLGKKIQKGEELSTFRAGGSAIAVFSTEPLDLSPEFEDASKDCMHVELLVGESITN
eukprot:CAMPEP_0203639330 /NCGR_PEP_ID=MMETSP0088-20131115/5106_1 /ASSEMBLY_ACC=CAM_ASM_001087 /TAXON_ID=426623 /ORGANISM="Chaetoceros affinis, Strain CCMP159" /LENGTH=290 /DNA_ID=CAMNT_0050494185 /DNA_START=229 /DNA_END=1098 /DNA_ORIENTATION=-